MADFKTLQGILALIDIVNYTSQSDKLGDEYTRQYMAYFQEKITSIARKYRFQVIKFMGDAALVFGKEPGLLLEIMLDLYERDKPEDRFGFISKFRMVAHSGYFQFQMTGKQPSDLVSPEGIKVFRMEKYAGPRQLMVTRELYQGIKPLLTAKNIEAKRLAFDEPLKGFDSDEWFPPFYRLIHAEKEAGASNLLEQRLDDLARDVEYIPVFGNMYPPVPMAKNFINLSILCDVGQGAQGARAVEPVEAYREFCRDDVGPEKDAAKKWGKKGDDDWIFNERFGGGRRRDFNEIDVETLYRDKRYTGGIIFGLPGAGKTTILRHLAHKEFITDKHGKPRQKQLVLFVPCRDIPFYDDWHKKQYGAVTVMPDKDSALSYMTWVFLFGSRDCGDLTPDEWVEFQNAVKKVKTAFKENRLMLLVDALDEAPDTPCKERITEMFLLLVSKNRLFLTSRPSERIHLRQDKLPVFNVLSLTMDQVRDVARNLMDEDSLVYREFDRAIWQEEMVVKMAATPITALLVTAYFQAYGQFDHRFPMYDLLMKFILVKVWENIKTGTFPYKNLELFFKEVKKAGFFEKYKDAGAIYDGLGALCFRLFFDGVDGKMQRQVNEATLKMHFKPVIAERFHYDEDRLTRFMEEWIERFQQDHLLLRAGAGEFVFIHSSVMEFLAAFYIIQQLRKDPGRLPELVGSAVRKEDFLALETVPIAAGNDLLKGFAILGALRDIQVEYARELLHELGIKCLAELEWQMTKTFQSIRIEGLRKPVLEMVRQNRDTMEWIYDYLKGLVLADDKVRIREYIGRLDPLIKLSRETLFKEFLDYEDFDTGDSELVDLRKQLLNRLAQKELVEQWLKMNRETASKEITQVLQLDSRGYHPEDKNFKYFQEIIGKELTGFLGSPNLKHSDRVRACAITPDGKTMVSASEDQTLKLWDLRSGKKIRTFTGHTDSINSCTVSPDGKTMVSASEDHTLKLWDLQNGKKIRTFTGHKKSVFGCAISPDGKTVVSASGDQTLKLWDLMSGKEIRTFYGHHGPVLGCAVSSDEKTMVSASGDQTLKLWDLRNGKAIRNFTEHKKPVFGCAVSPDGKTMVSASSDQTLKLWDMENGKEIRTFAGHQDIVWGCAISLDGKTMVSTSWDDTLKLWDMENGKEIRTFTGHQGRIFGCAVSPDGKVVVSASDDQTLKLWDTENGKEIRTFTGHQRVVYNCAVSPDGKTVVSASLDKTLKLWDLENGKEIRTFAGHQDIVWGCTVSPDGKTVLSASWDQTLKLWDMVNGKEIRTFTGHHGVVYSCAVSPDGKTMVSASYDRTLKFWELLSGKEIQTFTGHQGIVWGCAVSPDEKTMVSASDDKTLRLWDMENGKAIRTFEGHTGPVYGCVLSPDGKNMMSASWDATLKLWTLANGKEIRTFYGHTAAVRACAVSADGKTMVSASDDNTIKLWETSSGKLLKSLTLPWTPHSVAFSPRNPGLVITANANGTLTLFQFEELKETK
ncbi:MAG: NACHT domain-containing protein [Candidatus Aminicenantes bacterium]|nr:NACHT domain-containing protein [Candidatus Aminicenantes bacterium]